MYWIVHSRSFEKRYSLTSCWPNGCLLTYNHWRHCWRRHAWLMRNCKIVFLHIQQSNLTAKRIVTYRFYVEKNFYITYAKSYLTWSSSQLLYIDVSARKTYALLFVKLKSSTNKNAFLLSCHITHVDSISELQSKHLWQLPNIYQTIVEYLSNHCQKYLSNQYQTFIEPLLNVYHTTFNPIHTGFPEISTSIC